MGREDRVYLSAVNISTWVCSSAQGGWPQPPDGAEPGSSAAWDRQGAAIVLPAMAGIQMLHAGHGICISGVFSLNMQDEKVTVLNGYSFGKGKLRRWTSSRALVRWHPILGDKWEH